VAAKKNLLSEGIADDKIYHTGDVMYDTALFAAGKSEKESSLLEELQIRTGEYCLATIHRAENCDNREKLATICQGLSRVADSLKVVLPLHPRTRQAIERFGLLGDLSKNLFLLEPVGYLDMVVLEKNARVIATDSGGVQKEAFFYGVPCVTLRAETEWVELCELNWNQLVPPESAEEITSVILAAEPPAGGGKPDIYGDGHAARKIVQVLCA
jgi:UDP-GlcNAc3NAcA epimerase